MIGADRIINYRTEPVYARQGTDWYREPRSSVEAVRRGPVHGFNSRSGVRRRHKSRLVAIERELLRDLPAAILSIAVMVDRRGSIDFLDDYTARSNIVTNPPYVLAEEFVRHALKYTRYRVAVLVRLAFLEGQARRRRLFVPFPPELVLVLSTRPSMPPGDLPIAAKGGKVAYAWVTWNNDPPIEPRPSPTIGWLP